MVARDQTLELFRRVIFFSSATAFHKPMSAASSGSSEWPPIWSSNGDSTPSEFSCNTFSMALRRFRIDWRFSFVQLCGAVPTSIGIASWFAEAYFLFIFDSSQASIFLTFALGFTIQGILFRRHLRQDEL